MLFLRKLHKWLGLVIGLQVVLWAVSGVIFAWLSSPQFSHRR
jgi:Na+-transporting NADH:ubiquinone oxidoreductase subunit F